MKKTILILLLVLSYSLGAQKIIISHNVSNSTIADTKNESTWRFTNTIKEIDLSTITIDGEEFIELSLPTYVYHGEIGSPNLPAKTLLLDIPMEADIIVNILEAKYEDFNLADFGYNIPIVPVQAPIRKSDKNPVKLSKNNAAYQTNTFNTDALSNLDVLGIAKNIRLGQLNIRPVQYLPLSNTIRVYYYLDIEVVFSNTKSSQLKSEKSNVPNPIIYQIVTDRKYETNLEPFILWKTEKGFKVEVAYTDQIGGTTTAIQAYLQGLYDNRAAKPAPDYLLLVGDVADIPAFMTSFAAGHPYTPTESDRHVTDLYYADYTNDNIPDVFYGRLSASTTAELDNQIEKIIAMEKLEIPSLDFLGKSLLVAGYENRAALIAKLNATVNYGLEYYFNTNNQINAISYSSPTSGNNASQIIADANNGVGFFNYTGHGDWNQFQHPAMSNSNINTMTNENQYPVVIGNCCLTGRFEMPSCFAETWLRAEKKGAVAYIGASNSSYFDEDLQWSVGGTSISQSTYTYENTQLGVFDRLFHTHGESYSDWSVTLGQMMFHGNMSVQTSSANNGADMKKYYWEIYHTFGDPSYMPYMKRPDVIPTANHPERISRTLEYLSIQTIPYAYVGFSSDGILYGGGLADENGHINLPLQNMEQGEGKLVITAQNYQPYTSTITIDNGDVAYLKLIESELLSNNTKVNALEAGSSFDFNFRIKNPSDFSAKDISFSLSTNSELVEISQDPINLDNLGTMDSLWISNKVRLKVNPKAVDGTKINIIVTMHHTDSLTDLGVAYLTINAPAISSAQYRITSDVNGDNCLDVGETASASYTIYNTGHAGLKNATVAVSSTESFITINNLSQNVINIPAEGHTTVSFTIGASGSASLFDLYDMKIEITTDSLKYSFETTEMIGQFLVTFENAEFHSSIWDTLDNQWSVVAEEGVNNSQYCAKSNPTANYHYSDLYSNDFDCIGGDSIYFYYKVSSEDCSNGSGVPCGDGLEFYIVYLNSGSYNFVFMDDFYGEIPWTRAAFPVEEGVQSFNWSYNKDGSASSGEDAAWIDNVIFPKIKGAPISENQKTIIPEHIAFDVVVNNGTIHARINAENPGKANIKLINLNGQTVAHIATNATVHTGSNDYYYSANQLPQGLYICSYHNGQKWISRKIMISK